MLNFFALLNRTIQLLQVQDQQVVDAILTEVTDKHLEDARTLWEPILEGSGQDDEYWNWVGKSRRSKLLPGDELYAIECEGVTQGPMMLDVLKNAVRLSLSCDGGWYTSVLWQPPRGTALSSQTLRSTKVLEAIWWILPSPAATN